MTPAGITAILAGRTFEDIRFIVPSNGFTIKVYDGEWSPKGDGLIASNYLTPATTNPHATPQNPMYNGGSVDFDDASGTILFKNAAGDIVAGFDYAQINGLIMSDTFRI
jgi:hypothetical protein